MDYKELCKMADYLVSKNITTLEALKAHIESTEPEKFGNHLGLDTVEILVDYSLTLEQMIAAGRYYWTNSDITAKRFPIKGEGKVSQKAYLVHLNRNLSSEDVIKELDKQGKRPATIDELLAFGAKYPEIQRKFPVVALGSSAEVDGDRDVAYLCGDGSERDLSLVYWGGGWSSYYRFLAFDK